MDLGLREDGDLGFRALDDGAHIGSEHGSDDEHGQGFSEGVGIVDAAQLGDEFLQARGLHGELSILSFAAERFEKLAVPLRREGDDR